MPEQLRTGVVGLAFGAMLANDLAQIPEVKVVAVADHTGRHLRVSRDDFCSHFGSSVWYDDGLELIETEDLDAVVVATPPSTHRQLVTAAAKRKMHVLLEKPMAVSAEDCVAMREACRAANVILKMEFPMRELPAVAQCKDLIANRLGPPLLISADYVIGPLNEGHWAFDAATGGSPINENTCHLIDTLRFLAGDIVAVNALVANVRGRGKPTPDCASFSMRFASGAIGSAVGGAAAAVHGSRIGQRINIYCETGQATLTGRFHTFHRLEWNDARLRHYERDYGAPPVAPNELDPFECFPLHIRAVESFVRSVQEGTLCGASGEDGQAAVEVCLAVLQSGRTGTTVRLS
jgi:predicted dehydrogenase